MGNVVTVKFLKCYRLDNIKVNVVGCKPINDGSIPSLAYLGQPCRKNKSVMKKSLHPFRTNITIISTDGSTFELPMMHSKNPLKLDLDSRSHFLWNTGVKQSIESKGQIAKFKRRFKQ